jgi:hypothetical protein
MHQAGFLTVPAQNHNAHMDDSEVTPIFSGMNAPSVVEKH